MGSLKRWLFRLLIPASLICGIYVGGILVMWNYALPELYKTQFTYAKYKQWKKEGTRERLVLSAIWPIIVFEKEIPYDYNKHEIDKDP